MGISSRTEMTTLDGASRNEASRNGLVIHVSESRSEMGARAASGIAHEVRARLDKQPGVRMIFAAAPSQNEMLSALRKEKNFDWARVTAFHMDEYLDLPADAPQCFGRWLRQAIFDHLPPSLPCMCSTPATIPPKRHPNMLPGSMPRPLISSVVASAPTAILPLMIRRPTLTIHSQ